MNMLDAHRLVDLEPPVKEGEYWFVYEQLYPESRGRMAHSFRKEEHARRFFETGEMPE